MTSYRLPKGGLVYRDRPLTFTLNGRFYRGVEGDSLASALLANGERLLGRSFKYHRPRGIVTAGSAEPNALLTVGEGAAAIPNQPATLVPLHDGLSARTQNAWPSLRFDLGAVSDLLSPFLGAGFYYKTFIAGGPYVWRAYEYFIRRAAGLGRAGQEPDPARCEKISAHCDLLIVGGGAAGLSAGLSAARAGVRLILVDEGLRPGSSLKGDEATRIEGRSAEVWRSHTLAELESLPNAQVLTKTTAFGLYDGQIAGLVQRLDDPDPAGLQARYWVVRTRKIILATGAQERPLAFANNDRPGVMLVSALHSYVQDYGVLPGFAPILFTNNDSAYLTAQTLLDAGARSLTLVDSRAEVNPVLRTAVERAGGDVLTYHAVVQAEGRLGLEGVQLVNLGSGQRRNVRCDVVGLSGGWSPAIQLTCHRGAKPVWSPAENAFIAAEPGPGANWLLAGSVQGRRSLVQTLKDGSKAGAVAARALGYSAQALIPKAEGPAADLPQDQEAFWVVPNKYAARAKAFVDFQHDVTTKDVQQAAQEGFLSPEHMKRYTTLGMATDQGKLGNTIGQALLAQAQGRAIAELGTTTYRPPFTPVPLGAFTARDTAESWIPERTTPLKLWHEANGAKFMEVGDWRRTWFYPRGIEDITHASRREAFHVRQFVGLCDISTLGKIELQGPDAGKLLDLVYVNRMARLKVGRTRYGVMLREDGVVLDDGTVSRLAEDRFFLTTTTAEASPVLAHLDQLVQVEFPDWDVHVTCVSDVWAALALAGPRARQVLAHLLGEEVVDNAALPYLGFKEANIAGQLVRLHRISFSGELAYEIYTSPRGSIDVWQAILAAGTKENIDVYGLEALDLLRIEKGFLTGNEIDGRTTLKMLGLEGLAKDDKDFIGRVLRKREALVADTIPTLVGLESVVPDIPLKGGGQLVREAEPCSRHEQLGYVSSAGYSTTHGRYLGLGFLRGGLSNWQGKTLYVADPVRGRHFEVRVVNPVHVDPEGTWVRG